MSNDKEKTAIYVFAVLFIIGFSGVVSELFGNASGLSTFLILITVLVSIHSYVKQLKSTIADSVALLPDIRVGIYVIRPMVFNVRLRPPWFTVLQFKLYEKKEVGLTPANMKKFLEKHFEEPVEQFEDPEKIAVRTSIPSGVDIEWAYLDPEGLRIRTKSIEATQIRRLAEQTTSRIHDRVMNEKRLESSKN